MTLGNFNIQNLGILQSDEEIYWQTADKPSWIKTVIVIGLSIISLIAAITEFKKNLTGIDLYLSYLYFGFVVLLFPFWTYLNFMQIKNNETIIEAITNKRIFKYSTFSKNYDYNLFSTDIKKIEIKREIFIHSFNQVRDGADTNFEVYSLLRTKESEEAVHKFCKDKPELIV